MRIRFGNPVFVALVGRSLRRHPREHVARNFVAAVPLSLLVILAGCARVGASSDPANAARGATLPDMPSEVTSQAIAEGQRLFSQGSCRRCHGAGGVGGTAGPRLKDGPWLQIRGEYPEIVQLITRGVSYAEIKNPARRIPMDPRGGVMNLTDEQVRVVAAYVYSITRAKP